MRDLEGLKRGFDVRAWLDDVGVTYATGGANTTQGWLNITCPFCPDHSNHLGINLKRKNFHCWLCGENGDALKLVRNMEGLPFALAVEWLEKFQSISAEKENEPALREYRNLLPNRAVALDGVLPAPVVRYLARRKFDKSTVTEYGLMWCGADGEYPLRLIIPVRVGGRVVTWQAADVTGMAKAKYVSCPNERSLLNIKDVVYGIDDVAVAPLVVVVEGVTDRWRVGRHRSVALFGKEASGAQLLMLHRSLRGDARVVVMLDADAHEYGVRLGEQLAELRGGVEVALLGEGDPGGMTAVEVKAVLKEVIER
jgi:DNA primase